MTEKQFLIVSNGKVVTLGQIPRIIENGAVCIDRTSGLIAMVDRSQAVIDQFKDAELVDADGRLILPGFICAHTHFYSMFFRDYVPEEHSTNTWLDILQNIWWKFDNALTLEDVFLTAASCVIQAIKCGTTTIINHHSSPNAIAGSLDEIAKATLGAGIRACLSYEVSDRNSEAEANAGISENIRFIQRCVMEENPLLRASFGLHASFTLSEKTLDTVERRIRREVPPDSCGVHVHVAESSFDQEDSKYKYGLTPIQRLDRHGLLGPQTLCVHCVCVSEDDEDTLQHTHSLVVHTPASDMDTAIGFPNVHRMMDEKRIVVGLGTDGIGHDMLSELRTGFLGHKLHRHNQSTLVKHIGDMLFRNNADIATRIFDFPIGQLTPGAAGDVVIMDDRYAFNSSSWYHHVVYALTPADIAYTIVGGKILLKEHRLILPLPQFDEKSIAEHCQSRMSQIWKAIKT